MKAYWVLNYDITNPDIFADYRLAARPLINKLVEQGKAKVLIVDDNVKKSVLEGKPRNSLVVIEFINREEAEKFHNSKEYQNMYKLRLDNSDGWGVIIDGI